MAASYGAGGQSPPVKGRPVDRVFEDAQFTGEVNLSGRKLKDYPKICTKYDLGDTIHTDLSKNRFSEAPTEVCDYCNMERLNCYHNIIKSIPEAIIQLQSLTHLNLSRNQLAVLPVSLCTLSSLEVLLASNNKLVSLPEEIGKLERLMDLDVSCNEISHLPPQIGDLRSLRSLNLRRNLLVELPLDICKLSLRRLDISSNRIEKIPTVFRKLEVLEDIILEHNPLSSPPAHICTRGRQHIMKYLHTEAVKEDRKRGILTDSDMKRLIRKSLPPQQTSDEFRNILEAPEAKWKRHTVLSSDSGYSTADSLDKCGWNQAEGAVGEVDHNSVLAIKAAAEAVWEQRQSHMNSTNAHIPSDIARARLHPTPASPSLSNRSVSPLMSPNNCNNNTPHSNSGGTPSPQASSASGDFSQVYNTRTIHSPLPQRHSNHHHHHLNHQPFHQRQNFYNQLQSQSLQQQSHYHSHAPPPLSVVLPPSLHGQLSLNDLQSFHQTNQFYKGSNEEFPPPPAPLALVEEEELTPPVTPPTPLAQQVMSVTGSLEDEFTRELQRQKQEYEQRKKAAEQIRLAQEDKEREERRKAALKVQEEQKALLDRQREEQQRKEVERRQQEEQLKMQEQQRLLEEQAKQEEEARLRETEETRAHEEERLKEEARQQEEARKNKATNKKAKAGPRQAAQNSRASARNETSSAIYEQPTAPPQGLRLHDNYSDYTNVYSHRYGDDFVSYSGLANTSPQSDYILSEWEYRNALSSQSLKEQRRIVNNQYRRTVSDTTPKRSIPTAININSHIDDGQNHITRNGVAEEDTNISPTHSSKPTSPTTTNPNLSRQQAGGDRAAPAQNSGGRRSKGAERSNVPTPTSGRSVSRTSSTSSVNSVHSQSSSGKTAAGTTSTVSASATARGKNHLTPTSTPKNVRKAVGRISRMYTQPSSTYSRLRPPSSVHHEEEFRQKHQQVKTQHQAESQRLKSRLEEQRSKGSASSASTKKPGVSDTDNKRQAAGTKAGSTAASRNTRTDQQSRIHLSNGRSSGLPSKQAPGLSAGAMKMLEEYKDANPNFTIRRRDDQQREENQQLEALRQTIESRLKVTLPDNLPEALRDGVVLCHLANQIRPRSVASIHVPSPAVPKLTSAKCRRNVENFLDACRKIGVDQVDLCTVDDIVESLRLSRIAATVVRLGTFRRITPSDYRKAHLCIVILEQICMAADIMDERGVHRVAITVAALVAVGTNPRQSAV